MPLQGHATAGEGADLPQQPAATSPLLTEVALGKEAPTGIADEEAMKKALMPRKHRIAYESIQRTKRVKRARLEHLEARRDALSGKGS